MKGNHLVSCRQAPSGEKVACSGSCFNPAGYRGYRLLLLQQGGECVAVVFWAVPGNGGDAGWLGGALRQPFVIFTVGVLEGGFQEEAGHPAFVEGAVRFLPASLGCRSALVFLSQVFFQFVW